MKAIKDQLKKYKRDSYLSETQVVVESNLPVIDCEVGYSPFGCSDLMLQMIKQVDFSRVSQYPEMFYAELLKPVLINYFEGSGITDKNIFFGHGSFNLAERIIHKLIKPTAMLGYGPQFNEIPTEMVSAGGKYLPIPIDNNFNFPLDKFTDEIENKDFSIVYIDNPNNPTGSVLSLEELKRIIEIATKNQVLVLIDEAYADFVDNEYSAINLVKQYSNIMVIRSFSKALGLAAARVGYLVVSDNLIEFYSKIDVPFEPVLISAWMAKFTLEDKEFITKIRTQSQKIKSILFNYFRTLGIGILPTNQNVSIMNLHKKDFDLFSFFSELNIKVENGAAYNQTCSFMNNSFVRLRIPKNPLDLLQRLEQNKDKIS